MIKLTVTNLNGTYKLKYYEYGTFDVSEITNKNFYPDGWMDANVPEDVRTTLKRYGYLEGYYYGKDLNKERWIEQKDWVYYRSFYVDDRLRGMDNTLCFEGLDTVADIWLNGVCLGRCENMFLEHNFNVTEFIKWGEENRLAVHVISPIGYTEGISREGIYPAEDTTRMLLHKSQMNWGWDFCGHCLTMGIWKDVVIKSTDSDTIKGIELITKKADTDIAVLRLVCHVKKFGQKPVDGACTADSVQIEVSRHGNELFSRKLSVKEAENYTFFITKPALWWPRPYGEPALYDIRVQLIGGERTLDEQNFRYGIRTVELIQEKDEGGRSFLFTVNGKKLFIRGANWVPLNCVYGEIREEEYDIYMDRIMDSNITMLRIWGGGIYESEHFLDLCDENGIMIFQDMMLACGIYPQNEEFLQEVREEVRTIVAKNINRACIAIWSADNELDEAYRWYDMLDRFKENRVNREAVREGVEETDSSRPFLVSSPCSPFEDEEGGDDPNSDRQGDMHLYLTRFNKGDIYYYKKILELKPRFLSEYGFSSLPWESSYYRFNFFRKQVDMIRDPWLAHLDWLEELWKKEDVPGIIYGSQFTHAQGLKYWIEYLRSLKWHCGGSLYWKFNDPIAPNRENMLFPSLMSCIDFFRLPKLAYYYARRAYQDVILAFREDTLGNIEIYGCNETEETREGILTVTMKEYGGRTIWEKEKSCKIEADSATLLNRFSESILHINSQSAEADMENGYGCYLSARFWDKSAGDRNISNLFHLTEIGDWNKVKLKKASIQLSVCICGPSMLEITVRTDCFAQDVTLDILKEDVYYSDNGFCLEALEEKTVIARLPRKELVTGTVRVRAFNAESVCKDFY